jgi:cysteine desulfurase
MEKQGLALSKMHIVVSEIEHSSILSSAQAAKDIGISVSYARVDKNGIIMMKELEKIINPQTIFVSVMKANNEIGAIQPIKEISKLLRHKSRNNFFRHRQILDQLFGAPWPVLHSDWSQALLYIPFQARHYNGVSLVSFDSQKIYGPKGVGALFVRRRTHLVPIMYGGKQESGLRPGTENVPLIAGFSEAVSLAEKRRNVDIKKISSLRDLLLRKILSMGGGVKVNGSLKDRLPNNLSIYIPNINADFIVTLLDEFGISISTKSACLPYESASHVLTALGLSQLEAQSVLRISLGRYNTKRDIEAFLRFLRKSIDLQNSVKFY